MGMAQLLRARAGAILRKHKLLVSRMDDLTSLADDFGSDKGNLHDAHGYTRVYSRLFEPFRNLPITLLEMGLLRPDLDGRRNINAAEGYTITSATRAPSLEMWRAFFPKASIFGFDIDDFSSLRHEDYAIIRGDMASIEDLSTLTKTIGCPIDIIIDDASHLSHHQQIALGYLFPHLRPGGLYIIEDLCWQDKQLERHDAPKTRNVLRRLLVDGVFDSSIVSEEQRRFIEENLANVFLFDSLTHVLDDATDSLAVLRRK